MKYAVVIGMIGFLPLAAQAQSNPQMGHGSATAVLPSSTGQANSGKLSPTDANFVAKAAASGMAEVEAGQLAVQSGGPKVKPIGERMVADHTRANNELIGIAKSQEIAVPTSVDPTDAAQLAELRRAQGQAFDNAYLTTQLTDHQTAIALFQQEADQGSDPALKNFAAKTLPILKMHLQMVQQALSKAS
jgi:putative membrane protein